MTQRRVVMFCMGDRGHFQRMRSLISGLSRLGVPTKVFTHRRFQAEVEQEGGEFGDLFAHGSVDETDDESWPFTVRYVTFAAQIAERLRVDVEAFEPALVISDTFAIIGRVMAGMLGVPYVNVCAGHNVIPERFVALMEAHPRVKVSSRCLEAVSVLRNRYGILNASPFSYASGLSRSLNVYCEPPAFLEPAEREVFEPMAFYGSLPALEQLNGTLPEGSYFADAAAFKVYLSFGTVIWSARATEAMAALGAFAEAIDQFEDVSAVISLGGAENADALREAVVSPRVSIVSYVNQWKILQETDLFVTHHGLNSTHEAVFQRVPMISYPFVWDQPGLAKTCQRLGLAVSVVDTPMSPVMVSDAADALRAVQRERSTMRDALAIASEWERETIAARPAVLQRILDLAG